VSIADLIRKLHPDAASISIDSVDIVHEPELLLRKRDGVIEATPVVLERTDVQARVRMRPRADEIMVSFAIPAHPHRRVSP